MMQSNVFHRYLNLVWHSFRYIISVSFYCYSQWICIHNIIHLNALFLVDIRHIAVGQVMNPFSIDRSTPHTKNTRIQEWTEKIFWLFRLMIKSSLLAFAQANRPPKYPSGYTLHSIHTPACFPWKRWKIKAVTSNLSNEKPLWYLWIYIYHQQRRYQQKKKST